MLDLNNETGRAEFGNRIKNARTMRGLTQEMLGEQLYCNRSTISQWERGENLPEYGTLAALCDTLDCDVGYLFGVYNENNNLIHNIVELTGLSEKAVYILERGNRLDDDFIYLVDEMICEYSDSISVAFFNICAAGNCERIANIISNEREKLAYGSDEWLSEIELEYEVWMNPFRNQDENSEINIPEGTILLSAEDASEFYIDKVVRTFRGMVLGIVKKIANLNLSEENDAGK